MQNSLPYDFVQIRDFFKCREKKVSVLLHMNSGAERVQQWH